MRFLPTAIMLAILMIATLAVTGTDSSGADPQNPYDTFPDADVIITDGSKKNTVNIYSKTGYDEEGQPLFTISSENYGTDIRAVTWSRTDGVAHIVMTGGSVGRLTLLYVDRVETPEAPIDVVFDMIGGEATSIIGMSLANSVSGTSQSFFNAYCPVTSMTINIDSRVGELSPANGLAEIKNLDLTIGSEATVNRLYPTGNNARILNVDLTINGGRIGYISNQNSVVNNLTYNLNLGSIDYLCLGADTEGGVGYRLSDFWTFYVCRDVDINITPTMRIGRSIIGSGILDAPNVLCNGEVPAIGQVRNVVIDANGTEIISRTCFVTSNGLVLRFSTYQIGGNPVTGNMHSNYVTATFQNIPVYGDNGIWSTYNGTGVPQMAVCYIGTGFTIPAGCTVDVKPGGTLVNSSVINLQGKLVNKGVLRNEGVIVQSLGSAMEGDVIGNGLIAYGIEARPNEGKIDVMSTSEDAIVLKGAEGDVTFNHMSVHLPGIGVVIDISTESGRDITFSTMIVSVRSAEHGSYNAGWDLYIEGLDVSDYEDLVTTVTVSIPIQPGYIGQVFDANYREIEITEQSENGLTFVPEGNGLYFFRSIPTDETAEAEHDRLVLNSLIAIAIVIFATIALVYLLRKR